MSRINEIVEVNNTLGSEVNLVEELFDTNSNRVRMASYMPTKGHREAFEKLVRGLYDPKDKKCYILNGSYGTGKSNLLLMYANYLLNNSKNESLSSFFENYIEREKDDKIKDYQEDKEKNEIVEKIETDVERIRSYRESDKPYFIALCKYGTDGDFTAVVLRALKEAFDREGIEDQKLDSIYHEAVRTIKLWKDHEDSDFYGKLSKELDKTNRTVDDFISQLDRIEGNALEDFKKWHSRFLLTDFTYGKDNLVDILKETMSSDSFKEKYSGISIFFDEFGEILKNHKFNEVIFQEFGELCQNSLNYGMPLIFIATTHKSFTSYSEHYQTDEFKKVSDRFEDISLSTEGFEDIMGAIVKPLKENPLWQTTVEKGREFNTLASETTKLKLFSHIKGTSLKEKIIKNLFPMHPVATYALLELSKELASNNRSVFSFFTRGEFENYTTENSIKDGEKLNFYTANSLIDYFGRTKFSSDNSEIRAQLKNKIRNYEASLGDFSKFKRNNNDELDTEYSEILDLMLIFSLINIPSTLKNIVFGLNVLKKEEGKIQSYLDTLVNNNIIYQNKSSDSYEFKQSDILDIHSIISEELFNLASKPLDIISEIDKIKTEREFSRIKSFVDDSWKEVRPLPRLKGDFKFERIITNVTNLESSSYMQGLMDRQNKQTISDCTSDGYLINILCETEGEIERAKRAAEKIKEKEIIIAIAKEVREFKKPILGIKIIEESSRLKDLKSQEQMMCDSEKKKYGNELYQSLVYSFKSSNLNYFLKGEQVKISGGNVEKELVTTIIENKYDGKLSLIDLAFNKRYSNLTQDEARTYNDLLEKLLDLNNSLKYDSLVSGKVDDRYFKLFIDAKIMINMPEELQLNEISENYKMFPALEAAINKLIEGELSLHRFKEVLLKEYALGKLAMQFIVVYLYRYFNGNISFIDSKGVNKNITNLKDVENFVQNGEKIKKININNTQKNFVSELYKVFKDGVTLKNQGNLKEAYSEINDWFSELQPYEKISTFYENGITFIFENQNEYSPEEFILGELHKIVERENDDLLSAEEYELILIKIKTLKNEIEKSYEKLENNFYSNLAKILSIEKDEVYQYFANYYEVLEDYKKDEMFSKHTSETKQFLKFLKMNKKDENFVENAFSIYCGNYKNWDIDKTIGISKEINNGLSKLNSLYLIPDPELNFEGDYEKNGSNTIYYGEQFKVKVKNLNMKEYTTYYTVSSEGLKISDVYGTSDLKILNTEVLEGIKAGTILHILNQEENNGVKKQSNEIIWKFRSTKEKFKPTVTTVVGKVQKNLIGGNKINVREPENTLSYDFIPKKKNELKSAIEGLIETTIKETNKIQKDDIIVILKELVSKYSRGN